MGRKKEQWLANRLQKRTVKGGASKTPSVKLTAVSADGSGY